MIYSVDYIFRNVELYIFGDSSKITYDSGVLVIESSVESVWVHLLDEVVSLTYPKLSKHVLGKRPRLVG